MEIQKKILTHLVIMLLGVMSLTISCDEEFITPPEPQIEEPQDKEFIGVDFSDNIKVSYNRSTGTTSFTISGIDGWWKIYGGPNPEQIDLTTPIAMGSGSGIYDFPELSNTIRYFRVVTSSGRVTIAERRLPITGVLNIRDLGGYKGIDGRRVKWGKLFRSEMLNVLTPSDLEYLTYLPLISVVDFRSQAEINTNPDRYPTTVLNKYNFPLRTDIYIPPGADWLTYYYTQLVSFEEFVNQYKSLFAILMNDEKLPLLFHCTAGRDRTGMGAALILLALGVDKETAIGDFLVATGAYASPERSWMEAGLSTINTTYGSIENFFTNKLAIDLEAFRGKYLY